MAEERFHMMAIAVVFAMFFVASALYLGGHPGITGYSTGNGDIHIPSTDGNTVAPKSEGKAIEPYNARYLNENTGEMEHHIFTDSNGDGFYDNVYVDSTLTRYNDIQYYKTVYSEDEYIVPPNSIYTSPGSATTNSPDKPSSVDDSRGTGQQAAPDPTQDAHSFETQKKGINKQPFLKTVNNAITFGSGLWMLMPDDFRQNSLWETLGKIGNMLSSRFWISEVCAGTSSVQTESEQSNGIFTANIGGFPLALVNVVGEKVLVQSPNVSNPNVVDTKYYYKIEYWVSFPDGATITDEDDIKFYVQVSGNSGTHRISSDWITVEKGSEVAVRGTDMIYAGPTYKDYSLVCLVFSEQLVDYNGDDIGEICDTFNFFTGGATGVSGSNSAGGNGAGAINSAYDPGWATD